MNLIQLQSAPHQQLQHTAPQTEHLKLTMDQLAGLPQLPLSSNDIGSQGESSGRSTPNSDSAPGKLFVGGLSWQTNQERLREYFGQFGTVTDVLVMKDPITQRSRGFGFITFSNPDAVDRVLSVPSHCLDGKKIDPKHATPKSKSKANKTKKIFVGGVSQETSSDEVKAYFNQFGKVDEAVMLMDQQTKRHRGFGFVTFEHEEAVDRVCEIHFHTIKNKKVECKKAQPKEVVQAANTAALLGKRVILSNLGILPGLAVPGLAPTAAPAAQQPTAVQQQHQQQLTAGHSALQAALQQQLAASAALGGYGKLLGTGGSPSISSHRYSPYSLPSGGAGQHAAHSAPAAGHLHGAAAGHAGGVQYTVASPLMSQLSAGPGQATVLPTSTASHQQQQHLEAVAAAGAVPGHVAQAAQGPSLGAPLAAGVNPYQAYNLAGMGGVDWSALGYGLPAPAMYSL